MSPTNTIHIWNFHPYMVSHTVMQYYLFLFRSRLTGSVSVFITVRLQHILFKPLSARSFFVELLDLIADVGFSRANTLVNVFSHSCYGHGQLSTCLYNLVSLLSCENVAHVDFIVVFEIFLKKSKQIVQIITVL